MLRSAGAFAQPSNVKEQHCLNPAKIRKDNLGELLPGFAQRCARQAQFSEWQTPKIQRPLNHAKWCKVMRVPPQTTALLNMIL